MIHIDHTPNTIQTTGLDSFFMSKYRISAYSEQHSDIAVHLTTPDVFDDAIKSLTKGAIALNDGASNAYNPREKTFKLTRKLLLSAHAHCSNHAVVMVSNRQGMLRDIDIFKALSNRQRLVIVMPITHRQGNIKRMLQTMYDLKSNGIPVGAITPDLYRLNPNDAQKMLALIGTAGADFIVPAKMSLKRQQLLAYREHIDDEIPMRIPMHLWRDWFSLSDTVMLTASHLQILLAHHIERYQKLGDFKRTYARIATTLGDDEKVAAWLCSDAETVGIDPGIKRYLSQLVHGDSYNYTQLNWLPALDDIK